MSVSSLSLERGLLWHWASAEPYGFSMTIHATGNPTETFLFRYRVNRLVATLGTAARTQAPATFAWGVTRMRLLAVRATFLTVTEDLGVAAVPTTVAVPLRLNSGLALDRQGRGVRAPGQDSDTEGGAPHHPVAGFGAHGLPHTPVPCRSLPSP